MPKPRPGVAAGKRLSKIADEEIWGLVESSYPDVISRLNGFKQIEGHYRRLGQTLSKCGSNDSITKKDLLSVVSWKFSVGKPRHALLKHLQSNSEASVREHSAAAIAIAKSLTRANTELTKEAMENLMNLKGVGPATASAILTLVQPEFFAYMYDEAIECFLPERNYRITTFLTLNDHCIKIARGLGNGWTAGRVATALWIASRASAYKLQDYTLPKKTLADDVVTKESKENYDERAFKRRRKC